MKIILLCLLCCSCTTLYENGKPVAMFPSDMTNSHYKKYADGSIEWTTETVTPSKIYYSVGNASTKVITPIVTALVIP